MAPRTGGRTDGEIVISFAIAWPGPRLGGWPDGWADHGSVSICTAGRTDGGKDGWVGVGFANAWLDGRINARTHKWKGRRSIYRFIGGRVVTQQNLQIHLGSNRRKARYKRTWCKSESAVRVSQALQHLSEKRIFEISLQFKNPFKKTHN